MKNQLLPEGMGLSPNLDLIMHLKHGTNLHNLMVGTLMKNLSDPKTWQILE